MSGSSEGSRAESASTTVAEPTVSSPSDKPGSENASSTGEVTKDGKRGTRTLLPFWKMSRTDGSIYYLSYTKGEHRPVPADPTDTCADDLQATSSVNEQAGPARVSTAAWHRRTAPSLDGFPRRRCTRCGTALPLDDFVRCGRDLRAVRGD